MTGDWVVRAAWTMVIAGVCVLAALFIAAGDGPIDADRYEAMHVVSDPARRRHAVIYRRHRADAVATLDGIWIVEGVAPPTGSRQEPESRAIALWRGLRPGVYWKDGGVVVAADVTPAKVSATDDPGGACDFANDTPGSREMRLCFDPRHVTLVKLPR